MEEADYHNPAVLKVFDLIERDGLTPQDRARMKEEYNLEELKQQEYQMRQGHLDQTTIAELTGLTLAEVQSL